MSLIASAGADYAPAPPGLHPAVCCDVHDLGLVETPWGKKHRVAIIWSLGDELDERGRPFEVRKTYTLSLGSKSILRADLTAWRGKEFTADQLMGWDIEQIIGANCQLMVTHVTKGDRTYANCTAIVPPAKGASKIAIPQAYVRRKDREQAQQAEDTRSDSFEEDPPF